MAFSVSKSRPFRSLGLYKSSGKHAAPKGFVPVPHTALDATVAASSSEHGSVHHPAHAATTPRLTGPSAPAKNPAAKASDAEKTAA
jgi:hypothetical protein